MPPRSKISQLPEEIRAELDRRLIANGFGGYVALSEWLAGQGYEIGKSAVHEYGQAFEERLASLKLATQQAKAVVSAAPDDEGAMGEALMRLVQEKLFGVLMDLHVDPETIDVVKLTRSIAELGRASVTQKRWAAEWRAKLDQKMAALDAEAKTGKARLDPETLRRVREEIYGIA